MGLVFNNNGRNQLVEKTINSFAKKRIVSHRATRKRLTSDNRKFLKSLGFTVLK